MVVNNVSNLSPFIGNLQADQGPETKARCGREGVIYVQKVSCISNGNSKQYPNGIYIIDNSSKSVIIVAGNSVKYPACPGSEI